MYYTYSIVSFKYSFLVLEVIMNNSWIKCRYKTNLHNMQFHFHNDYEIIYVTEGQVKISVSGMEILMGKGDMIFLNKNANHNIYITGGIYNRYIATISSKEFDKHFAESDLLSLFRYSPNQNYYHIQTANFSDIANIFDKIISESQKAPDRYTDELITSYLREILIYAWRLSGDKFVINDDIKSKVFKVQNILENNYQTNITIEEICKTLYISTYYLTRNFTKHIGISPKQYLIHIRLNNAGKLLKNTSMSIAEISEKSGFQSTSNFIAYFKKYFGITPRKFRDLQNE